MVRLLPPVLLTVSVRVWLVPTCTFPNVILAGAAVRSPGDVTGALWVAGLPELNPWHPTIVATANTTTSDDFQRLGGWPIKGSS